MLWRVLRLPPNFPKSGSSLPSYKCTELSDAHVRMNVFILKMRREGRHHARFNIKFCNDWIGARVPQQAEV